jgi:hypothetical protein
MELIDYKNFIRLKLDDFISEKEAVRFVTAFEFLDDLWTGLSIGFTEWLQLEGNENIKSISLDLTSLPEKSINQIIHKIGLNLKKGMTANDVLQNLGKANKVKKYTEDRISYEYLIGIKDQYYLSVTISDDVGLNYIVITNHAKTINDLKVAGSA